MLKSLFRVLVLAAFLITAVQSSAFAADGFNHVEIVNKTGKVIEKIYATFNDQSWTTIPLVSEELKNGKKVKYTFNFTVKTLKLDVFFKKAQKKTWNFDVRSTSEIILK